MAEIAGATVDFVDYVAPGTPRVLNIPAAHGNASAQDLWDTLSAEAAKLDNLIYKKLVDRPKGGGKSVLRAGRLTGIILPMNNVQIQFEPSTVKLHLGSATAADPAGKLLVDDATDAGFVTANVQRGDVVLNATKSAHATVLRVLTENRLVTTSLMGGLPNNEWEIGDTYEIFDHVKRNVTDGDVIAQDHNGDSLDPILTAFGVDSTVELSTSPALISEIGAEILDLADGVETDVTLRQALRVMLSALAGVLSGAPGGPIKTKNAVRDSVATPPTKDRIASVTDGSGNRSSVVLDPD